MSIIITGSQAQVINAFECISMDEVEEAIRTRTTPRMGSSNSPSLSHTHPPVPVPVLVTTGFHTRTPSFEPLTCSPPPSVLLHTPSLEPAHKSQQQERSLDLYEEHELLCASLQSHNRIPDISEFCRDCHAQYQAGDLRGEDSCRCRRGCVEHPLNPYRLSTGQTFGTEEMLCLRVYERTVLVNVPWVSAFQIRCGILQFSDLVEQTSSRAEAFACRSAAWAAVAIGAAVLGRDSSCYLDNALQGLPEYYDSPAKESTSALLAICDLSMTLRRSQLVNRCINLVDIHSYEAPPSSSEQCMCIWLCCLRASQQMGVSTDGLSSLLRFGKPDMKNLSTSHQVTIDIVSCSVTMMDTLLPNELTNEEKLQRCAEASRVLYQILPLAVDHLFAVFANELHAFFLFRLGKVREALDRFRQAVEYMEKISALRINEINPIDKSLSCFLLRVVERLGGCYHASLAQRSQRLLRSQCSHDASTPGGELFERSRVLQEILCGMKNLD